MLEFEKKVSVKKVKCRYIKTGTVEALILLTDKQE
jgi:hypothetical protein